MERILIIKLGAVGDVIHTLPMLETLHQSFPKARLGWAVEEAAKPILEGNPALSDLVLLERKKMRGWSGVAYFQRWVLALRQRGYDTVLDPHNLFKSGLITFASGAGLRVGFKKLREGNFIFMNRRVEPAPHHRHAVEKYLSLLEPLGIQESQWVLRFPLFWDSDVEQWVDQYWREQGFAKGGALSDPVVAVNPGANWPSKRWMPERYAQVAERLSKDLGVRILILWGPGERPLADRIARAMSGSAAIAPETNLKQLTALIKRCRMLILGDTGPLHMAAALGVPSVSRRIGGPA